MVAFIEENRDAYGVEPICEVLPMAPSTYYAQRARAAEPTKRSARSQRHEKLLVDVERVFRENLCVYGARKVWKQLLREGHETARCTVARLMARRRLSRCGFA